MRTPLRAVSYTHLDVYKRQRLGRVGRVSGGAGAADEPVDAYADQQEADRGSGDDDDLSLIHI